MLENDLAIVLVKGENDQVIACGNFDDVVILYPGSSSEMASTR